MRAAVGALLVCCATVSVLSGCTVWDRMFHRRPKDAGCVEKPFSQNTETRLPLKVPEGLSAPDTRNAIRVPDLTSPERMRARSEPCLSRPPSYFTKPLEIELQAPPSRQHWWQFWRKKAPAPKPAQTPAPASTPEVPATPK
jgi:hypothetical protein